MMRKNTERYFHTVQTNHILTHEYKHSSFAYPSIYTTGWAKKTGPYLTGAAPP